VGQYYKYHDLRMIFPFYKNFEAENDKKQKFEERRMRVLMRGVKIGSKRGGTSQTGMAVFEFKDQKMEKYEREQMMAEKEFKEDLSDETLGITSE